MTSPQFTTGIAGMEKAFQDSQKRAEAAKKAAEGGGGKIGYFNWKPNDTKVLRFLTDELITAHFHEFIFDSTGKTKNFMIPPNDPTILSRYQSPSPGIGWKQDYKSKQLVDPGKPAETGCGIAVLRQQVLDPETGKLVTEDYLYEQEIDGKQYLTRHYGIIQQKMSNFWHTLIVSCYKQFGTLCDRDYLITRTGESLDTKYSIIPLNPDPDLDSTEKVQQFYFYGTKWDNEDPQRFLKCPSTLMDWADYYSGEDRYKFWLTPGQGASAPKDSNKRAQGLPTYSPTPTPPNPYATASHDPTSVASAQPVAPPPPVVETPVIQQTPVISVPDQTPISDLGNTPVVPAAPTGTNFAGFKADIIAEAKRQAAQSPAE